MSCMSRFRSWCAIKINVNDESGEPFNFESIALIFNFSINALKLTNFQQLYNIKPCRLSIRVYLYIYICVLSYRDTCLHIWMSLLSGLKLRFLFLVSLWNRSGLSIQYLNFHSLHMDGCYGKVKIGHCTFYDVMGKARSH